MGTNQELTGAPWRKSSYSGTSGDCIECAAFSGAEWRKSSYSGTSGECLEVAQTPAPHIAIRDSKNPTLGHLHLTPATFTAFVNSLK